MKRYFDFFLSMILMIVLFPLMLVISLWIFLTSKAHPLYYSDRVGKNKKIFKMPKFRTMRPDTPEVATHLLDDVDKWLLPGAKIFRALSIDEVPQLINILKGEMSFVGPRPALFNQHDLVEMREIKGIYQLTPGLTGWAQINGRDELSLEEKVNLDEEYLNNFRYFF